MKIIFKKPFKKNYDSVNKRYSYRIRFTVKFNLKNQFDKETTCSEDKFPHIEKIINDKYKNSKLEQFQFDASQKQKNKKVYLEKMFFDLVKKYREYRKQLITNRKFDGYGILSITYKTEYFHMKRIQQKIKNFNFIKCDDITPEFVNKNFLFEFRNSAKFHINKGKKCYDFIKKAIIYGRDIGWIKRHNIVFKKFADDVGRVTKKNNILPTPTKDEVKNILKHLPFRSFVITTVLVETGLRIGELNGLFWSHLDKKNKLLLVSQAISDKQIEGTKTENGNRDIPINEELILLLEKYKRTLGKIPKANDFIFPHKNGSGIPDKKETNYNQLMRICKKLGYIKKSKNHKGQIIYSGKFGNHAMRRFFRTQCVAKGIDNLAIDYIMGQSSRGSIGERRYTDRKQLVPQKV